MTEIERLNSGLLHNFLSDDIVNYLEQGYFGKYE